MFSDEVNSILPSCIEWRRRLHRHPELSFKEKETTAFLIDEITRLPEVEITRPCDTGVVAILI